MPVDRYPPPAQLLPHRAPMIFLDRVIYADTAAVRCQATVGAGNPLLFRGRLPPSALLEYLAQAAAAHRALVLHQETGDGPWPVPGYLVMIREAVFANPPPALGQELEIFAALSEQRPPFFTYAGTVDGGGAQLCHASFIVATEPDGG